MLHYDRWRSHNVSRLAAGDNHYIGRKILKGECSVFLKKNYVKDENDSLSEYIKIPLGHNRTNGAVSLQNNFKVEICSAL